MKKYSLVIVFSVLLLSMSAVKAVATQLTQLEGSLISFYIDKEQEGHNHGHSELRHYLRTKDGKAYRLHFKKEPGKIKSLKLKGLIRDRDIDVESYAETASSRKFNLLGGTVAEAQGNQRTLVVPIKNTSYNSGFLYTSTALNDLYFSNSAVSIQSYYKEVSDSAISFTGNVASVLNVAGIRDQYTTGLCVPGENLFDGYGWLYAIDAIYQQHALANYDRLSIVVPNDSLCLGSGTLGIGTLGKMEFEDNLGNRFSISFNFVRSYTEPVSNDNTFVSVTAHEFGHNLGLKHDNGNACGKSIFNAVCASVEYGGAQSIMGFATKLAHVNAIQQEDLGWFTNEIVNISGTQVDQTVTISAMASDSTLPKAIKISRGNGTYYMVEYRKPVNMAANEAFNASTNYDGFLVYLNDDNANRDSILMRSDMLDIRSSLSSSYYNGLYYNGPIAQSFSTTSTFTSTFTDDVKNIHVIPVDLGSDTATLRVVIGDVTDAGDSGEDGGDTSSSDSETSYLDSWELTPYYDTTHYSHKSQYFSLNVPSFSYHEFTQNVASVKWDFDGDGLVDSNIVNSSGAGHVYFKSGTYTVTATVVLKNGLEKTFTYENFVVEDYINSSLGGFGASTSAEPTLNYSTKTKLRYSVNFADGSYSGRKMKIYFLKDTLRSHIKSSKKFKKMTSYSSINFPVLFDSEANLANDLFEYKTDDGYYEIPIALLLKTGKNNKVYLYTSMRVKSSI